MRIILAVLFLFSGLSAGFLEGTWVKTTKGPERVQTLKVNDEVPGNGVITHVVCYEPENLYVVTIQDEAICVTASVEFWDPYLAQWVPACELTSANHVQSATKQWYRVHDVAQCPIDERIVVYNLSIDPFVCIFISLLEIKVRH